MRLCSIASGSSGNCIYIGGEGINILVDTGISKKKIEEGLQTIGLTGGDIDAIFITHEHSDHISGIGVMSRAYKIPIYATRGTIRGIMEYKSLGNMPPDLFHEIKADEEIELNNMKIEAFTISHDAYEPTGYKFMEDGKSLAVATDLGEYTKYTINKLCKLNAVFLEANHDIHMLEVGSYPYPLKRRVLSNEGHLSNELSGRLLCDILHKELKYVMLGHLSRENNYEMLAYETVKLEVNMSQCPYDCSMFELSVAKYDTVSEVIEI